ncbi:MAG TPA: amidohydrolase family protein [Kofleriaceae bacterium]|jgi:imidazolonepropionase-like amidohydrolase|nr:amidohydrolase family protein [Kofleriaceae bacterium]
MTGCRFRPWSHLLAVAAVAASLRCARPTAPEPVRASGEPVVAFVGVTLLSLDTAAAVPDQTVVVRGERIERVGPRGAVEVPPEAQVIAGRGHYLMPGLIDAHVHLARTEDLAILVALGVTTVRNMWGAPIHLEWRDRVARGELPGPAIYTAGPIVDGERPAHPGSLIVRSEADADRAIALHRQLGYDLVKVYSRLAPPVFDRLADGARRAGLPIAGHVPWSVALGHAVDAGMRSIEHMTGVVAALQAADAPVAGRSDGPWRDRDIDHVDEARIAGLVQELAAHHTFMVPTRVVMDAWAPAAEVRDRLAQPEMRWVPRCNRALAEPRPDDAEDLDRARRTLALYDRVLGALDAAGAPIAAGTDASNPLVVPGFALHRELEHLVGAGLSPLAALQAATRRGAELLGREGEVGRIAAGMRADLLLLDASPLDDIRNTRRIAGVMARGRYRARGELDAMLERVAAGFAAPPEPFRGAPALAVDGDPVFRAEFDITWADAPFGVERVAIGQRDGRLDARLESYDIHMGALTRAHWQSGTAGRGASLALDLDGATGRGHLDIARDGGELHARGTSLPGVPAALDRAIATDGLLAPDAVLSRIVLWRPQLVPLAAGQTIELVEHAVGLASEIDDSEQRFQVQRGEDRAGGSGAADATRVYEITPPRGPRSELVIDADGWPLELAVVDHGAPLRLRRRP